MSRLFPTAARPRIFALPPGADFIGELAAGLDARLVGQPPESLADVEIVLNTRRAVRALEARLAAGPARLLPRIRTVTEFAEDPLLTPSDLAPPENPLRRRLDLARLVRGLLRETASAPPSAAFGLADSLADLLDELGGEGIDPARLGRLDAAGHAAHWQHALRFLDIAARYAAETGPSAGEARLRAAVEALARDWAEAPPARPILLAGSTGSRAPTRALMRLIANLPQGAVILPGLDPSLPPAIWSRLGADSPGAADHPQHAFRALGDALGFEPGAVPAWIPAEPPSPARNALLALALRPAPVTDQWRSEAPAQARHLSEATARLAWMEAESPRAEADAIALALRDAAETGTAAALVTSDRTLARRVTARLARWNIIPDDSAGRPLAMTPPGVLLTLLAGIPPGRLPALTLLALLKHPLTNSGPGARGPHLRLTQALEAGPLAGHPPLVDWPGLDAWAVAKRPDAGPWLAWLQRTLAAHMPAGEALLGALVARHRAAAEALAAGPEGMAPGALWQRAAGEAADALLVEIAATAGPADRLEPAEYRALVSGLLHARAVPGEAAITHPGIAIWGTLEARSQHAAKVILGGLNEGTWPRLPGPDPWLSRPLRRALGLPAPETLIGLAAHYFTQAAAAPEVILSRATRDAEAPTVPSRWLLRLENLLKGMGPEGEAALEAMRDRGCGWLRIARRLDAPDAPEPPARRPSPVPPIAARPRTYSISRLEALIRDPFSVYARDVLRLRPLDPPGREADALARGTALHGVMEAFLAVTPGDLPPDADALFRATAERCLAATPWPAIRAIWAARLARIAPWFLSTEAARRTRAEPFRREVMAELAIPALGVALTARADRIDRNGSGAYAIYDYKSGLLPTEKQIRAFHVQLPLEAAMVRAGAFAGVPPAPVVHLELIGLGGTGQCRPVDPSLADVILARVEALLVHYLAAGTGFTARLRPQRITFGSDYDHLARYGEWSDSDEPWPEPVG